jgi:hypothetical protein
MRWRCRRPLRGEVAQTVVGVTRDEIARIGDGRQVVVGVVIELRDAGRGIGDLLQPIELVMETAAVACEWGGDADLV